ncbi:LysR family transcriptional regulator [Photobacterium sp. OFAV2-7]|uniref:LysR family transcriptional regulator n=1 Tax=Photobacterium sp. OFAV2-7 TaxID=2917748 RepID=UPI001EF55ED3|nr:LysR family transcriptional regulator [Photobacterium sp. OFAV2-7]MCG7586496.1 LysR family transcriptional regulator [Photobacterium sp. OFAV2-7]
MFKAKRTLLPLNALKITRQCNFSNKTICKGLFMNEMGVNWNDLQLFLSVAREGGLSAAAKSSQRSPATLGRRMHALERSLGKELFVRHDRGYELLADGEKLLKELTVIESQITTLTGTSSRNNKPLVKISAGTWTTLFLIKNIDQFSGTLDDTLIRFISTEKILDISHREAVIGIRNSRPTDETLVCRKLKRVEFAPYSTKEAPEIWIKVQSDTPSGRWLDRFVSSHSICEVSIPRNSLDLALEDKGIALLPTFIGDAEPQLQRVGNIIDELGHDQWIVTHHEDRYLPEVRNLISRLGKVLR